MVIDHERYVTPVLRGAQDRPWNLDGYQGSVALKTSIFEVDLGDVRATQVLRRRLLSVKEDSDSIFFNVFEDFPPSLKIIPEKPYAFSYHRFSTRSVRLADCADIRWSNLTDRIYLLDVKNKQVHRFGPTEAHLGGSSELDPLILRLPAAVELSLESRLALIERSPEKPEELDPELFITAPQSGVVLKVDLPSQAVTVVAGQPGRRGRSRQELAGQEALLRYPTSLAVDADTGSILFVDAARYIYRRTRDGILQTVAKLPRDFAIGALEIYRLSDYVDTSRLEMRATEHGEWGAEPVLLLFAERSSGLLYKISPQRRNPPRQKLFAPVCTGIQGILPLTNGDLLLPAKAGISYLVAQERDFPSPLFYNHLVS